jgi:hypothetical protein
MDLTKLSSDTLQRLRQAGGDLSKLSDEDLYQLKTAHSLETDPTEQQTQEMLAGVKTPTPMQLLGQALGYTSGIGRTAVAAGADKLGSKATEILAQAYPESFQPMPETLPRDAVEKAISGEAYSGKDLLRKALALKKLSRGQERALSVGGAVFEGAADPGMLAAPIKQLGIGGEIAYGLLNPLEQPTAYVGKKIVAAGVPTMNAMAEIASKGKDAVSNYMLQKGIFGSARGIDKALAAKGEQAAARQGTLLGQVATALPKRDYSRGLDEAIAEAAALSRSANNEVAAKAQQTLKELTDQKISLQAIEPTAETITREIPSAILDESGKPILTQVTEVVKTPGRAAASVFDANSVKSTFGSKAYPKRGTEWYMKATPTEINLYRQANAGMIDEIQRAATQASPELGQALSLTNEELGLLQTIGKGSRAEAEKEARRKLVTEVDPMAMSLGILPYLGKQAARFATPISTTTGTFINKAAPQLSGAAESALGRYLKKRAANPQEE